MRYLLTLLVGVVIGFGVAMWEPARDLVRVDKIASVATKVSKTVVSEEESVPAEDESVDFRALAQGAKAGSELVRHQSAGTVFAQNEQSSSSQSLNIFSGQLGLQTAAFARHADDGADVNDSSEEIAQFEALIALYEEENAMIDLVLQTVDPQHPQHSLLSCYRVNNESMIGLFDFWIQVAKDQAATEQTVSTLAQVFNDNQTQIAALTDKGRGAALGFSLVLRVLPAKTDTERLTKSKTLEAFDTYPFAFDVEDAIALHNLDFIALLSEPVTSEEAAIANLEAWSVAMSKLVDARLTSQLEREKIAEEIMALVGTS